MANGFRRNAGRAPDNGGHNYGDHREHNNQKHSVLVLPATPRHRLDHHMVGAVSVVGELHAFGSIGNAGPSA